MKNILPIVMLKPGKERALKNFHPWLFSGAIKKKDAALMPGDVVKIVAHDGQPLALGHYCEEGGLSIRLFSFDTTLSVSNDFWQQRFYRALGLRKALSLPSAATNGYRLIHGEGDELSGLVCDIFGETASIRLSNPGLRPVLPHLSDFLQKEILIKNIFLEQSEEGSPQALLGQHGDADFLENGLRFVAHISQGQKTGHFLDQRENRALVKAYAHERRVLDAFCYSGGFSVYALAGGASSVTSIDISDRAVDWTKEHVLNNGPFRGAHEAIRSDCFNYLRTIKPNDFDMIILDPPAFAKSAHAVEKAARGYKDINLLAMKALKSSGLLFSFSCSQHISMDLFKKIIFAAAKDSGRHVVILHELSQAPDHPVSVYCPQSSYLKGLVLYVL